MNSEKNITTNLKFSAIRSLVGPEGQFAISGDGDVTFLEGTSSVTDEQITTEMARIQAEYDAQAYARVRQTSYPSIGDQLDMQYHDQLNGTTTWKDAVAKVKTDNPKPE